VETVVDKDVEEDSRVNPAREGVLRDHLLLKLQPDQLATEERAD
jgi:hypothetical protein